MNNIINDDLYETVPASKIDKYDQSEFIPVNIVDLYQLEPFSETKKYNNNYYNTIINFFLIFLIFLILFIFYLIFYNIIGKKLSSLGKKLLYILKIK
jgi:hypothetical protein